LGRHYYQVTKLPLGYDRLRPGQAKVIVSVLGDGADRVQVAAGTGLAHCDRGDDFAGTVARQPALALVLRTQPPQILPVDIVVYGEARTVKTRARQLLVEDRVIPVVRVTAA